MTIEFLVLLSVFALIGASVSWVYFFGLWRTVRCLRKARMPFANYVGSLVVRTLVISTVLTLAAVAGLENLAASIFGFVAARFYVLHKVQQSRSWDRLFWSQNPPVPDK